MSLFRKRGRADNEEDASRPEEESAGLRQPAKVFCIGRNKTGTTTMAAALKLLGYNMPRERQQLPLLDAWARRDFGPVIEFCRNYDALQDMPFSYPFTFQALDQAFPGSKFILTVRSSADEWYESLTRFHTKLLGTEGVPTMQDLETHPHAVRWRMLEVQRLMFGADESSLYDRDLYQKHYERHNETVIDYFRNRSEDLLVLNLADRRGWDPICQFLERPEPEGVGFPWENRT
ncbi:MAG: hypothetical protein P1U87_04925 [Verrucomicrobiales bacterium]|nr:hypothetical protein [Verrucomicrobiales bacterium]